LRVVFAQGIDLTKGEAVGIDLGHVVCAAVGTRQTVAHCWLIPDYRAFLVERIKSRSPLRSGQHHIDLPAAALAHQPLAPIETDVSAP
jgi:hypothetical protein